MIYGRLAKEKYMFTLLAFPINILLNPLICKVKYFLSKKQHQQTKIILPGVFYSNLSQELLFVRKVFLHKSISEYVRLRKKILRFTFIASPLHSCQPWSNITTLFPISVFFSSGHFRLDSVYIKCLFSRSYFLVIDIFSFDILFRIRLICW